MHGWVGRGRAIIPSGESPDGTGGPPVPTTENFSDTHQDVENNAGGGENLRPHFISNANGKNPLTQPNL
jgi:hypothetical protein